MDKLTVGELAERTQTTRRALRLYEQIGIITPEREANGYRVYSEKHVEQVLFIRALRTIGATLKDLRTFYAIKDSDAPEAEKHRRMVSMIDDQVALLVRKRDALDAALAQLGEYRGQILDKLASESGQPDCTPEQMMAIHKEDAR